LLAVPQGGIEYPNIVFGNNPRLVHVLCILSFEPGRGAGFASLLSLRR
jgi:hypothetical protein